ncbi:VOC family protein [Angustibacter speluncae]
MVSSLSEVAVDCADPDALARFWCAVLGYEVQEVDEAEGYVCVGPAAPSSRPGAPTLGFAHVPEAKAGKNRLHLDVRPADGDRDAEVERLLALGATRAGGDEGLPWVVLRDPEGNEFCVLAPPADGSRPG